MDTRARFAAVAGFLGVIASGSAFIAAKEGVRYTPYTDIGGVKTWCYGQTVGVPKARYSVAECDADLVKTVTEYHAAVMQYLPKTAPQSVQVGFTSVAYNVGKSGWRGSLVTRNGKKTWVPAPYMEAIADGNWVAACMAISAPWQGSKGLAQGYKATVKGKPARGLENRRRDETAVCLEDL